VDEVYRKDYDGEFVVTGLTIKNGKREQTREWIDNPITVNSISGRAVCVSNGAGSEQFNLQSLTSKHGLLNSLALNVYATDGLYTKFKPNFLVTFNTDLLANMISRGVTEDIITYTSGTQCIKHPGEFYLIPYGRKGPADMIAAYLAAFDGHKEIYLVGYDEYTADGLKRRTPMIEAVARVIEAYPGIKFYHCIHEGKLPMEWTGLKNVHSMSIAEFISECDVSMAQWLRK
jgi:hypothetical protein